MVTHDLKVLPEFFDPVSHGEKTFELRRDDRGFALGDVLLLREWSELRGYTGRETRRVVTYFLSGGPWLAVGYVAMALSEWEACEEPGCGNSAGCNFTDAANVQHWTCQSHFRPPTRWRCESCGDRLTGYGPGGAVHAGNHYPLGRAVCGPVVALAGA